MSQLKCSSCGVTFDSKGSEVHVCFDDLIQSEVSDLDERVSELESEIGSVEDRLVERIQSWAERVDELEGLVARLTRQIASRE